MKVLIFFLSVSKRFFRIIIAFPIAFFAVALTKVTEYVYVAEFVSKFPFKTGNLIRRLFYKWTLKKVGENVTINFGTIITYKSNSIGDNVWLGVNNILGMVDVKDNVITAQNCQFASGKYGHGIERTDIPIIKQPGHQSILQIGPDAWFGASCTTIANVGEGCVIGSGSIVVKDIPDWSIAVGNPARVIKNRK
jgi:acetyltransferase-like isoleucine patch superfamily enzyme